LHRLGQVAIGVAAHQVHHAHLDPDMRGDQFIGPGHHGAELALEAAGIDAVADRPFGMPLAHFVLRLDDLAQLGL
ncbi:hypothetical protein B8W90_13640, partial [Staphylococcus hominis]